MYVCTLVSLCGIPRPSVIHAVFERIRRESRRGLASETDPISGVASYRADQERALGCRGCGTEIKRYNEISRCLIGLPREPRSRPESKGEQA